MKRKLFFITLLMLFCTTMFGQQHWTMSELEISFYQTKMSYYTYARIDGVDVDNNDIQIAAFHDNELRGCAFQIYDEDLGYLFMIDIYGTTPGDQIYFKLYKPDGNGGGVEYGSDFTINFNDEYVSTEIPTIDFYNKHWNYEYVATEYMQYPCVIKIDGVLQERTNLELAAFCGEELRGVARPQKENITEGLDIYMASLKIEGTNNETISFKLYDPTINRELSTDKTILFDLEYGNQNVVEIDFRNEAVAQIGDTYYKTLADAFAAVQNNQTITLITDVELSSAISFTKDITFTIDGNGKTIKPAEDSTEANSAFNLGQGNDGTVATRIYTIKNIVFDGWTTDHVVRLQGVNATVEGCTFQNCNQADGLGLLTLTSCEAYVKDCNFLNNTCVKAIDINSWGDNSEKNATIEECVFDNNECNTTAVIYRADGPKLVVKNSKFLNNTVTTSGNAATLYAGWATNDVITGCYFANNTVTTSHTTTIRFASAIFCDGCTVTGNAFENNTATRNGETINTTVAVGAYYGAANVSENYWGGDAPEAGVDYTVEFTSKDVVVKTYYKEYDATAGTLSELTRLPWAEFKQGYAGYVGDTETRENISVDLWDVYADNSVVVKIYSADNTLLSTTTLRTNNREDNAPIARPVVKETFTANVVVWGKLSGSWDTEWHVAPSVEYIPNKFEVWCDGVLCDTFVGFNHVDAYMALDGVLKVAKVTNGETITYYASLEKALKALTENATLTFLDNVTIAENWDCRSNGAKITVPVTIDGNGKTLKLTGVVNDSNWNTVFRIEKDATVKNLTIDVTEATGVQRCITTNSSIVADNCTFLGTTNTRYGIIVGEGAGNNIGNVTANINKCNFTNIQAGVSDNANGQDAKSFTITESNFNNADVVISAAENVTFNKNVMSNNSYVDIRSYAHVGQLEVEANDNTLQPNTADNYNQIIAKLENITAQEGFLTPVAEIDGKYYVTLQDAFDKGGNVKVLTDISLAEGVTVAEGKTVVLDLNGKKISRDTEAAISSAAITNNGNLTIKDLVGGGKVTAFAANPDTQAIPYYASNTITNCGVLTVLSGTIENSTGDEARAAYPIDNNSTLRDVALYIKGGTITGRGAIRQFANSETNENTVNVEGGIISGTSYAIWVQNPSDGNNTVNTKDTKAKLNISAGELGKILLEASAGFEVAISGGTISEVAFWETDVTNPERNPSSFITGGTFGMDVTEFCAFNYVCTPNGNGTYGIVYKPQEDNAFVIETLHELEAFRDAVNAGNTFSGQAVVLSAGVDLNPTRAINYWEPIGTQANPFKGTFDGGDNTIINLVVEGENNVGLFGYADNATIKNIKLENVNVKGTDCVGAIAGQVYSTSLIDNCHVSGSIQVEGQTNVGGIVGKYYTKVKNCSVIGDDVATSYVKGTYKASDFEGDNIAGIMGHGGENNTFENNTVKNITISGTRKVAGIVGVTDQNTDVVNCLVENVNIVTTATAEYAEANKTKAGHAPIVGSYTRADANKTYDGTVIGCTVKNVTFVNDNNVTASFGPITGGAREGMIAPSAGVTASNNNIYMSTITGTTTNMYLMNPVAKIGTTEYYTLFDAVAAVQDGETTITLLRNTAEEFAIDNTTANIILDMATYTLTGAITPSNANLTIKNGTINNENASYSAIEINAGTLVLNDVKVTSKRHGVRIDGAVTATIEGGEYNSGKTSGTRHAINVSGAANVTIKAGTFVGPKGTTADSGSAVNVQSGAIVTIEGGDFSGGKNHTLSADGTLTVKGGTFDQVVNASHLAVGYFCELNTTTNKYEVFRGLAGEGTEANPYLINNLSDLVFFRDHVNAGETRYNATGVWVALANDIDMTDIANWTPIGNVDYNNKYIPQGPVFVGVFNGNGKVISNLKVASTVGGVDTQANVGLFGITGEGAVIKDLTLTNVNIETDGRNVGAIAGFAYKATLDNIIVNGDIQIKGGNNVSGVAGMTRFYAMSATNISVSGANGSAIVGNNIVGGIFAEIAPNGNEQTFKNLSIENVAINGVGGVGGIVGLLTLGTVENVSVKNVVLTGRTDYQGNAMGRIRLGSVAGLMGGKCATIINPTVENVTAKNLDGNDVVLPIIGANYDASSNATEARIGDTYYATLKHAIEAAQEDETTIVMIADAEVSETVKVVAGQKITLDLNGKTIDGTEKVRIALMSYGDLTIKDSTEEKNGMIKAGIGTAGNTVNICKGTFTLESGNIYSKNNAILIDEQTATVNINGGTITAEPTTDNSAAFYISSTSDTEVNITAGTMKGFNGILLWNNTKINITGGSVIAEGDLAIQGNGSKDNTEINISGENTIITGKDAAIYHPQGGKLNISGGTITGSTGIVVKGGEVTISGGTINGTGAYTAYAPVSSGYQGTGDALYVEHYDNSTDSGNYGTPVVTVTGGTFNSTNAHPIASYANPNNASNGVEALAKFISGGTFNKVVEESLLAAGYALTENNGMYEVSFADYIVLPDFMDEDNYEDYFGTNTVTDGTNYYATLQKAVEAVVGQADAILYCKPGADVGSLQHAPVTNTLTVHGNDAYVSGGDERDFDLGNTDPSGGQDITSDMTLTVRYLDGCGAWGAKATEHTVNLVFENCYNMGKVFVTGTTGTLNITMNNCAFEGVISEALYSNADGTIALTDVAFSNLNKAVNLNHKAAGTQTVTMTRCTFTNCGNDVAADQIPVRVLSSVPGGKSELTVENCTFTGTPAGGADILLDYGVGLTEATITETNAKVVIERKNNEPEVHNVVDTQEYSFNNLPFVAEVDGTQFTSLQAAIDAADGKTVVVLDNITLTETVTVAAGTTVTLDLNGKNLTGGANVNLVIIGELIIEDNVGNAVSTFRNHYVSEGGKLTLKSGILQNIETNTGGYGIFIENGGESIIEGGTVQAVNESNYAICVNGTLTIVDGNIVGKHGVIAVENPNAIVTIKDGEYTLNAITGNSDHIVYVYAGMVNIEGGNFTFNNFIANEGDSMIDADKENVSITGGTYTHDVNEYCHEYYDAIQGADNLWRVEQVLFAQTTALHQGWNWYSSYVNLSTPDGLEKLQTALGENGVIIKSNINNEFVTYEELPNGEFGWVGNEFSIYNTIMYMIETSNAHEMTVAGEVVDGTGIMFMLTPGWNWIGYPIDKVQNIDVALSGLQDKAQTGDMIKHREVFAYFDASIKKWVGTLTQLEPGKGYKYKSNKSSMFFYTKSDAKETVVDNAIIDENYWKVESSGYANNMTITAMLSIDGEIVNDNYEIAAFANGECRGSARPIYVESKNAYMLFMTVFGDDVEELTFKYYDIDADTEYELSNVMNYSNDAIVGTIDNPYIFTMNILGIGENSIDNINIYPNPTTTDREINLQATCDKVEVFNALGVKVAEYHNVDTLDAFETAGIYVIRITNDNAVKHCRLVVK